MVLFCETRNNIFLRIRIEIITENKTLRISFNLFIVNSQTRDKTIRQFDSKNKLFVQRELLD
jgi:hypothetical protein